jgi:hypothetical protein
MSEIKHRGRIQAQGDGCEESEAWAQSEPPSVDEGLELVKALKSKLSSTELIKRKKAIEETEKFIRQAGENGGVIAQVSKSFRVKNSRDGRIDIEVIKGIAFIDSNKNTE